MAGAESFCREMHWDSDRSAFIHNRVSIDDLPQALLKPSTECIALCTIVKAMVGVGSKASSARSSSNAVAELTHCALFAFVLDERTRHAHIVVVAARAWSAHAEA